MNTKITVENPLRGKGNPSVQTENELGRDVRFAGPDIQLDAHVKNVLGNKIILSWIMHYTIDAFRQLSPEEIVPYIENTPRIGSVPVLPYDPAKHLPSAPEKIIGSATEHNVPGERTVYYDINFRANIPHSPQTSPARIIVNVEAQKSFYPGYRIESRGLFYCSRLISAQLGREFTGSHYNDIKKVYSIWLCMNAPNYIGNAISEYVISKHDLLPGIPNRKQAYDKQTLILICLNEKAAQGNRLTGMLNTLLSANMSFQTKNEILKNRYKISMSQELQKGVEKMCNYSEYVLETGRRKGKIQGRREGFETVALRMLKMKTYRDEEILRLSGISRKQLRQLKEKVLQI